jgi:diaminopimelate decarboxylase
MRCFISYDKATGIIYEAVDMGYGFDVIEEAIKQERPGKSIAEITPEDFQKIYIESGFYIYKDNKLQLKTN